MPEITLGTILLVVGFHALVHVLVLFYRRYKNKLSNSDSVWYPIYDKMLAELKAHGIKVYQSQKGIYTYTGSITLYSTYTQALWAIYIDKFGFEKASQREKEIQKYLDFLNNYRYEYITTYKERGK